MNRLDLAASRSSTATPPEFRKEGHFHEILLFPTPSSSRNRRLRLVCNGHLFEHCAVVRLARLTKLDSITSKNVRHMTEQQEMPPD